MAAIKHYRPFTQSRRENFDDITTGSNGGFKAGPGYDEVSGLGSPKANLVVNDLAAYGLAATAAIREALPAALLMVAACITRGPGYSNGYGNVNVDGTDTQAHVLPPIGYNCYPHDFGRDGYVL